MDVVIFMPLMVAAIQSAGQVLASFASKAKEAARNYIFDKDFFEDTIVDSSEQLAELLNVAALDVKQEIREQSIIDAVQDLQAHVAAIGDILSLVQTSELTPAIAERLITGGLLPLQVSLKKAELRLSQHGRDEMRLFCHVVGIKTLITGYGYVGQNVPTLQKDLEDSIYVFQKRLLDSIAQSNHQIPWNKIPHFLTAEGASDLFELYNSTLPAVQKDSLDESHLVSSNESASKPELQLEVKKRSQTKTRSVPSKNSESKPKSDPAVTKRKVRDMELRDVTRTARKLQGFLYGLTCSECGFKGLDQNDVTCPYCGRKFV
jgi:rubrerythrin